jgi:RNA polymerase sigma-70 factor (ECF subfamily)
MDPNRPTPAGALSTAITDEVLMERLSRGADMDAFGMLYDRHWRFVLNKTWGMVGEKQLAEDLAHDIFLRVFSKAEKFGKGSFISWLSVVSYNVVIDHLREQRKWRTIEVNEDHLDPRAGSDAADDLAEKELLEIRVDRLKKVLAVLRVEERTILLMKYQNELSVTAIAEVLKIGESAVKMRLKRARESVLELHEALHHGA